MRRVRAPAAPIAATDGRPLTEYQAGRAEEIAALQVEGWSYQLIMNAVDEDGNTLRDQLRRDRRLNEINGGTQ